MPVQLKFTGKKVELSEKKDFDRQKILAKQHAAKKKSKESKQFFYLPKQCHI